MKVTKGRKYIVFGNFQNTDYVAEQLKLKLDIDVIAFMSNTDNTTFIEYDELDSELINLRKENKELKSKLNKKFF